MQRNIIPTISFRKSQVSFVVLEKFDSHTVEIFSSEAPNSEMNAFLKASILKVEKRIAGKIANVNVVIDPSANMKTKIAMTSQEVRLPSGKVSQVDVQNALQIVKKDYGSGDWKQILVQPVKFTVRNLSITKSYWNVPVGREGDILTVHCATTSIPRQVYNSINSKLAQLELEIADCFIATQAVSQCHLSDNAMSQGAVLINLNRNNSFVTVNKNNATIAHKVFFNKGFSALIGEIVKAFDCTSSEAANLIEAYGTLDMTTDRVIYSRQEGISEHLFTQKELSTVIARFMLQIISMAKTFIKAVGIKSQPIVISGKAWQIEGIDVFFRQYINEKHISVYNPLSFIEMNSKTTNALGVSKMSDRANQVYGHKFDTIVETNPNSLATLTQKTNGNWFKKLRARIGGNYGWK